MAASVVPTAVSIFASPVSTTVSNMVGGAAIDTVFGTPTSRVAAVTSSPGLFDFDEIEEHQDEMNTENSGGLHDKVLGADHVKDEPDAKKSIQCAICPSSMAPI